MRKARNEKRLFLGSLGSACFEFFSSTDDAVFGGEKEGEEKEESLRKDDASASGGASVKADKNAEGC